MCVEYKPSSVTSEEALRHLSMQTVTRLLKISGLPLDNGRATLRCRYTWPCNPPVVLPDYVTIAAVGSYPTFSPLPHPKARRLFSVTLTTPLRVSSR